MNSSPTSKTRSVRPANANRWCVPSASTPARQGREPGLPGAGGAGPLCEGLAIHRQRNPFALVCGRVCPAFCEQKCRRGEIDEPISIRLIKRFMADQEFVHP